MGPKTWMFSGGSSDSDDEQWRVQWISEDPETETETEPEPEPERLRRINRKGKPLLICEPPAARSRNIRRRVDDTGKIPLILETEPRSRRLIDKGKRPLYYRIEEPPRRPTKIYAGKRGKPPLILDDAESRYATVSKKASSSDQPCCIMNWIWKRLLSLFVWLLLVLSKLVSLGNPSAPSDSSEEHSGDRRESRGSN